GHVAYRAKHRCGDPNRQRCPTRRRRGRHVPARCRRRYCIKSLDILTRQNRDRSSCYPGNLRY
ncbi:hypothetical protein FB451DRAFT_1361629, partial [Mycena latifolia]